MNRSFFTILATIVVAGSAPGPASASVNADDIPLKSRIEATQHIINEITHANQTPTDIQEGNKIAQWPWQNYQPRSPWLNYQPRWNNWRNWGNWNNWRNFRPWLNR
jgi:hypothetical protein